MSRSKKYISEFVYGSVDGTITTFAIISGVMGAGLSAGIILVLGISNVLADGFSMASSEFLSQRSEQKANAVELEKNPFKTALVTFLSFVIVGSIPITPFIVGIFVDYTEAHQFLASIIATGIAFLLIGIKRGQVSGEHKILAALETLLVGALAASIAFVVGYLLSGLV